VRGTRPDGRALIARDGDWVIQGAGCAESPGTDAKADFQGEIPTLVAPRRLRRYGSVSRGGPVHHLARTRSRRSKWPRSSGRGRASSRRVSRGAGGRCGGVGRVRAALQERLRFYSPLRKSLTTALDNLNSSQYTLQPACTGACAWIPAFTTEGQSRANVRTNRQVLPARL